MEHLHKRWSRTFLYDRGSARKQDRRGRCWTAAGRNTGKWRV